MNLSEPGVQDSTVKIEQDPDSLALNNYLQSQESKNLYMTEAIAYYNLGASYEHLGGQKLQQALKSYEIAQTIAHIHMPHNHPLIATISDSVKKVQGRLKYNQTTHMLRGIIRFEKSVKNHMRSSNSPNK